MSLGSPLGLLQRRGSIGNVGVRFPFAVSPRIQASGTVSVVSFVRISVNREKSPVLTRSDPCPCFGRRAAQSSARAFFNIFTFFNVPRESPDDTSRNGLLRGVMLTADIISENPPKCSKHRRSAVAPYIRMNAPLCCRIRKRWPASSRRRTLPST